MHSQNDSYDWRRRGEGKPEQIFPLYKLSSLISDEQRQPEMKPTDNREVN